MSAIAAIFRLDGRLVEPDLIGNVLDLLRHRGTDDKGVWAEGNVGLGHRMRWSTPESRLESLPFHDPEMKAVITFDGRLDNREELFEALSFGAKPAAEITDSEIVLRAYEKWGEACPSHLIGDFVFAIWNERERVLFAARDPLGVKHFYYYHQPGKLFAIASEIKGLFALDEIPCDVNEQRIGDYLATCSEDKVSTFYRGILRLPATNCLSVNDRGLRVWQYWKPECTELRLKSDAEYQEKFRELFSAAVTARLRSAYPVGSMLSGGLDSSSIVCVGSKYLADQGKPPLHTFSAVFPSIAKLDPRIDERRYMRSVIDATGCTPHDVMADEVSPFIDIEKQQWHTDHSVGAPMYMDWEIFKAAQKAGVRTVFSGFDGDSTVSHGYQDFTNLALRRRYYLLIRESIALRKNMPRKSHTLKRLIWRNGILKSLPPWAWSAWRRLRGRVSADYTPSPIMFPVQFNSIAPEFRATHDLENRVANLFTANFPDDISPIEYHWRALTNGHFGEVLENLEKASAAFEVEAVFPFFDRRLVEFCISLPPGQRIYRGWTRSIFRHAMKGIVPDDVLWRTDKSNIGMSVKVNMLKYGDKQISDLLENGPAVLGAYVDTDRLMPAYCDYKGSPMERDQEAILLLRSIYLQNWLEQNRPGSLRHTDTAYAANALAA